MSKIINDNKTNWAYARGFKWGYKYQEIDYDGSWSYDGALMRYYLDGCKAGIRAFKAGEKWAWRERRQ